MIRNDLAALQSIADQVAAHFKRPPVTVIYHPCPDHDSTEGLLRAILFGPGACDSRLYGLTRTFRSDPSRYMHSEVRINPMRGGAENDEDVLLHELAHHVVPSAGHSEKFYRTLVEVLKFRGRDPRSYPWKHDPLGWKFAQKEGYLDA